MSREKMKLRFIVSPFPFLSNVAAFECLCDLICFSFFPLVLFSSIRLVHPVILYIIMYVMEGKKQLLLPPPFPENKTNAPTASARESRRLGLPATAIR